MPQKLRCGFLPVVLLLAVLCWHVPLRAQVPMDSREIRHIGFIVVIDMQRMLTDYKPFVERMDELREHAQQQRQELQRQQEKLDKMHRDLEGGPYVKGSPHYNQLADESVRLESHITYEEKALQVSTDIAEAKLYRAFFEDVLTEVQLFAQRHNVALVINRKQITEKAEDLASAEALFGQKVIYERNVDITSDILDALDGRNKVSLPRADLPEPVVFKSEETK